MSSSDSDQKSSSPGSPVENYFETGNKIASLKDLYDLISEQKNILLNETESSDSENMNEDGEVNLMQEQIDQIKYELNIYCAKVKEIQQILDKGSSQGTLEMGVSLENKVNQSDFKRIISELKDDSAALKKELMNLENSINNIRSQMVDKNYLDFKMKDHKVSETMLGLESRIPDMISEAVNSQIDPLTLRLEQFIKLHINDIRKSFNTKIQMNKK